MTIIDSQVHAYEANTPKRPWHSVPNWPDHVTGDEMVAAMDKVGVDGAIFISAFSMYRYDASYAVEVQRTHPGRFAIVKPVDPDDPAVGDIIADWKQTPGAVGIRIMMTKEAKREPNDPGLDRILRAAVKHDFPVNILCWGNVDASTALIDRHPDTCFIIDHLAILQPNGRRRWMRGSASKTKATYPARAPERVRPAHLANERAQLSRDLRSANMVARSPVPIRSKPSTVPANDRFRPDNRNGANDGGEPVIEPNKQKTIGIVEVRLFRCPPAKHIDLLP